MSEANWNEREFALSAHLEIEEIKAGVDMKISETDGEMLNMSIKKLNVARLIRFTGYLAGIESLKKIGNAEDFFLIDEGSLCISSGVTIGSKPYPLGITASATVIIFDKTGRFDAEVNDSGFTGNGLIENLKMGALEVSAASDETSLTFLLVTKCGLC